MKILITGLKHFLQTEFFSNLFKASSIYTTVDDEIIPMDYGLDDFPIVGILAGENAFEYDQLTAVETVIVGLVRILVYGILPPDESLILGILDELNDGILGIRQELRDGLTGYKLDIENHERSITYKANDGTLKKAKIYTNIKTAKPVAGEPPITVIFEGGLRTVRTSLTMKYVLTERRIKQ